MTNRQKEQAEATEKLSDVLERFDFSVAEKVGILDVLKTSYILSAAGFTNKG